MTTNNRTQKELVMKKNIKLLISKYEKKIESNREKQIPMETNITEDEMFEFPHLTGRQRGMFFNEWKELEKKNLFYQQLVDELKEVK